MCMIGMLRTGQSGVRTLTCGRVTSAGYLAAVGTGERVGSEGPTCVGMVGRTRLSGELDGSWWEGKRVVRRQ
jgi:hypothetical protein